MKRFYDRSDEWLKGLSRGQYAVFLGMSGAIGVLLVGLLMGGDLLFVRAFTMGFVLFGLECVFGLHQTTEE